jgi:GH43 family beta-xylosidase
MKYRPLYFVAFLFFLILHASDLGAQTNMLSLSDIHIRDPFVVADKSSGTYYMYASISNRLHTIDSIQGVEVYTSKDLIHWNQPLPVFIIPDKFWAHHFVWAPEVHPFNGKYYLFVTFTSTDSLPSIPGRPQQQKRGTQVLVADKLTGPFRPFQNRSHTPTDWMALDGTLWAEDGIPYMVFSHEWIQLGNGTIELARLKKDLSAFDGKPVTLFKAGDAPWVRDLKMKDERGNTCLTLVTDGPFLYRTSAGKLLMIWSSFGDEDYSVGIAESVSGKIAGPWKQQERPLFTGDGGHGMIFRSFDGRLMLSLHKPNNDPDERAHFYELTDTGDSLIRVLSPDGSSTTSCTFTNPVATGDSPDPQVMYKDGYYYGCHTTGGDVRIYKSETLQDIFHSPSAVVWGGKQDVWAPEIHFLNGKWYVYTSYKMDSLWLNIVVLEGTSGDAQGVYTEKARLTSIGPAIDPSVWQDSADNQIYIAYSKFSRISGQEIWISKMSNPYTLQGKPVRLSYPEYDWEKQSGSVNEGPSFLKHGSKLHIIYSASQCHYENYCLGMLTAESGSNYMDTTSWKKSDKPVFQKYPVNGVYAVGHHCCIQTPGGEWWLVYHGKYESNRNGQASRDARMQPFTFNGDMPVFGVPVRTGEPVTCPGNDAVTK